MTIEIDYYEEVTYGPLNTDSFEEGIEDNFALYGMDVELVRDETIGQEVNDLYGVDLENGVEVPTEGGGEIRRIFVEYGLDDPETDEWLFVGPEIEFFIPALGKNPTDETMALFVPELVNKSGNYTLPVDNSPYETDLAFVSANTLMHEIGHSYCLGLADDEGVNEEECTMNAESYSGDSQDITWEYIGGSRFRPTMGLFTEGLYSGPLNGSYFIFSIEELSTAGGNDE